MSPQVPQILSCYNGETSIHWFTDFTGSLNNRAVMKSLLTLNLR